MSYYKKLNGAFYKRVALISCPEEHAAMGLVAGNVIGGLWLEDAETLLA